MGGNENYIFGRALAAFNKLSRPTWVYNCDIDALSVLEPPLEGYQHL